MSLRVETREPQRQSGGLPDNIIVAYLRRLCRRDADATRRVCCSDVLCMHALW